MNYEQIIEKAYQAFNAGDIGEVLTLFDRAVDWPNDWEGGYVHGHAEVSNYRTRQWAQINPIVKPIGFALLDDLMGILFDATIFHTYTFQNYLIKKMEISEA